VIRLLGGAKTLSPVQGFQTGSGIHSAFHAMSKERHSTREKSGQDVNLTCHFYLLLILRMYVALPTFPLMIVCTGTNLYFITELYERTFTGKCIKLQLQNT